PPSRRDDGGEHGRRHGAPRRGRQDAAPGLQRRAAQLELPEPPAKALKPTTNVRLRPIRSATLPATSTSPAKPTMYASMIHCSWLHAACRSRTRMGSETLRNVLSRLT